MIGILELIIHLDLHIVKNRIKYHLKIIFRKILILWFKILKFTKTLFQLKKTSSPLQTVLFICFLQLLSCSQNDETESSSSTNTPQTENNINSASTTPEILSFNLNDGIINFEDNLVNFTEQNIQPDNRNSGNWGRFGGIGSINLSLEYGENPNIDNINILLP